MWHLGHLQGIRIFLGKPDTRRSWISKTENMFPLQGAGTRRVAYSGEMIALREELVILAEYN